MKNILILCTGNSCRSQIAHGYLNYFAGNQAIIYSAGVEVHGLNPKAVEAMFADGIDISHHTSNHVDEYSEVTFDSVISVCDNAYEQCPYFPGNALRFHHNFPDPAHAVGTEADVRLEFERVREMIKAFCKRFVREHLQN